MSKGKFISIIVLLVTSLLAILYFQFNWILDINELNEDRFNKNVQDALFNVNRRLEEKEIMWKGRFPSGIDECGASQYCCKAQLSSYSKATHISHHCCNKDNHLKLITNSDDGDLSNQ